MIILGTVIDDDISDDRSENLIDTDENDQT